MVIKRPRCTRQAITGSAAVAHGVAKRRRAAPTAIPIGTPCCSGRGHERARPGVAWPPAEAQQARACTHKRTRIRRSSYGCAQPDHTTAVARRGVPRLATALSQDTAAPPLALSPCLLLTPSCMAGWRPQPPTSATPTSQSIACLTGHEAG